LGRCDACEWDSHPSTHINIADPEPREDAMSNRMFLAV
jgi:hypothetical protein